MDLIAQLTQLFLESVQQGLRIHIPRKYLFLIAEIVNLGRIVMRADLERIKASATPVSPVMQAHQANTKTNAKLAINV